MAIYEFEGKRPTIGKGSFIFPTAAVIGDVTIGDGCFIAPGASLRGDYGTIVIGARTSIEDNCIIHARPGERCEIGNDVTIGHGAVIHNATLHDWVVIGMNAVVSDYATIGEWGVVGEGAVVKNRSTIDAGRIAVGVPAKMIAGVNDEYKSTWTHFKGVYNGLAERRYPQTLKRIDD